ncbi:MAG: tetratricopeptide repeat protein, partial [Acidobacteriota bacterium]
AFADEIVIVDTGSSDDTRNIALKYTPLVYDFPWIDDFAAARNHAMSRASGRYMLWLDADDRFEPEMARRIIALKAHFDGEKAFYFVLENLHTDSPTSYCHQLRCVPIREGIQFQGRIHETLVTSVAKLGLPLSVTDIAVQHLGYMDHGLCLSKMERNLSILMKEKEAGRDDPTLHFFLGVTNEALERTEEAASAMEDAIDRMQRLGYDLHSIVEAEIVLARVHEKRGDKTKTLRSLLRAWAIAGDCAQHHYSLGLMFRNLGEHGRAAACLEKALEIEYAPSLYPSKPLPPRKDICLLLAFNLFAWGRNDLAMERMREAWALGADVRESWETIGLDGLTAGHSGLAHIAYEAALRAGGLSPDGWCNLGTLYKRKELHGKATECYEKALALAPGHESATANLGHLHMRRRNFREAKALFQTLEGKGDLDILLNLALIAATEKDFGALRSLRNRLADHPAPSLERFSRETDGAFFSRVAEQLEAQNRAALAETARRVSLTLGGQIGR